MNMCNVHGRTIVISLPQAPWCQCLLVLLSGCAHVTCECSWVCVWVGRLVCMCTHAHLHMYYTYLHKLVTSWDMLWIDVQGFTEFCQDFLSRHGTHFVSPLRLSGSAVESILGQVKYSIGGKLDAASYQVARAAFLTKQAVEWHHCGKDYRDVPLHVHDVPLERKRYRNWKKGNNLLYMYKKYITPRFLYAGEVGSINLSATCQPFASIQELQVPVKLFLVAKKFFSLHVLVAYVKHACQSIPSEPKINFI